MQRSELLDFAGLALLANRRVEVLTAATTLSDKDSGTTYVLNSATEFAVTLPAPKLGCWFKFIVGAAPSGADYTIVTASGTDLMHGLLSVTTVDDTVDGDNSSGTAEDTITFVSAKAKVGDWVELVSDGTYWYVSGASTLTDGTTLTHS